MSNAAFGKALDIDPELPLSPEGSTYHLSATSDDIADRIILVGDPGRVKFVASYFDAGSIRFESSHREINIATGAYKGVPVTVVSTGMGTDNVEIVVNEIHVLKEYSVKQRAWKKRVSGAKNDGEIDPASIKLIRVGTCGCPRDDVPVASLAITRYGIGMDNTSQYYMDSDVNKTADVQEVLKEIRKGELGRVQMYATKAAPEITNGLVKACEEFNAQHPQDPQPYVVGTTCSGSGFYGCQGRAVGHFVGRLKVPNMMRELGSLVFNVSEGKETVANVEMENSALCSLANILGYHAGTICSVAARRSATNSAFATPDETQKALGNAVTISLNALTSM